ncbi:MAG: tetratricopeptide repeat protein [Myxococcales bacterium]|nr:tetratricopeptide repeat protein [Myxococcales bacterium]
MASGDYKRAVASLERSIASQGTVPDGEWLAYMDQFPRDASTQAVEFAGLILKHYPTSGEARTRLGARQGVLKKYAEAKLTLEKTIDLGLDDAMTHWRLGEVFEQTGDTKRAAASYKKSLELEGDLPEERTAAYGRFMDR